MIKPSVFAFLTFMAAWILCSFVFALLWKNRPRESVEDECEKSPYKLTRENFDVAVSIPTAANILSTVTTL